MHQKYRRFHLLGLLNLSGVLFCRVIIGSLSSYAVYTYFKPIIENGGLHYMLKKPASVIFDNASVNRSRALKMLLTSNRINVVYLPPKQPELHPIELLWRDLKNKIKPEFEKSNSKICDQISLETSCINLKQFVSFRNQLLQMVSKY